MSKKEDPFAFIKKMQSDVQRSRPQPQPGETALEAMQRMEQEKMKMRGPIPNVQAPPAGYTPQQPQQPQQPQSQPQEREVIFFEGYKLPRDFFTCVTVCIMKLNDPEINKILDAFGFTMNDLNGKLVEFKKKKRKKAKKRKNVCRTK